MANVNPANTEKPSCITHVVNLDGVPSLGLYGAIIRQEGDRDVQCFRRFCSERTYRQNQHGEPKFEELHGQTKIENVNKGVAYAVDWCVCTCHGVSSRSDTGSMGNCAVRAAESATVQCVHLDNLIFHHRLITARNDPNIDKNGALCLLNVCCFC